MLGRLLPNESIICTLSSGENEIIISYLPNPSTRAEYDTSSIFYVEFNRFQFRVFLLVDLLPHQG